MFIVLKPAPGCTQKLIKPNGGQEYLEYSMVLKL